MNKPESIAADTPPWADPNLPPEQFLYQRKGPWPQPSPTYPMEMAPEVLNIPPIEALLWNQTIGARYLLAQGGYPPMAAQKAAAGGEQPIPSDPEFVRIMTETAYARLLKNADGGSNWIADFSPMELVAGETLPGTFCAPVICNFVNNNGAFECTSIVVYPASSNIVVQPTDANWNLAKVYALQGAAYMSLFLVHPSLHFPMDSVNAITKTVVPHTHPLFQLLYPHTSYSLALDNAVLEGEQTVVNNNAPGTWFDPLTANGYQVMKLFGVGYRGGYSYAPYDYMDPWRLTSKNTRYAACLELYFAPFLQFCKEVAAKIHAQPSRDPYVQQWAASISSVIPGFPDENKIFEGDNLATAMALYMWDVSVSHGADHYSFANGIGPVDPKFGPLAAWKFLRVRVPFPTDGSSVSLSKVGEVSSPDDLARAEMAQYMFFSSWTIAPNLNDTYYAFTSEDLLTAQMNFHAALAQVDAKVNSIMPSFMRLGTGEKPSNPGYSNSIPASIQY